MSESLRTQSGPWCGGFMERWLDQGQYPAIRGNREGDSRRGRSLSTNVTVHDAVSLWADPDDGTAIKSSRSCPGDFTPTRAISSLELDGDQTRALPGHFAPRRSSGPAGFRFGLGGCAKPKLFGGGRPEAYKAIAGMSDLLLLLLPPGRPPLREHGDESLEPRLEAYRYAASGRHRRAVPTLPIAYCWDDHDFPREQFRRRRIRERGRPCSQRCLRYLRPALPPASSTEGIYQSFRSDACFSC